MSPYSHSPLQFGIALACCLGLASAQNPSFATIPNGLAAVDGNSSNTLPWGRAQNGAARVQFLYDTSHFTNQGLNQPIVIQSLRWRANGAPGSWTGGTYASASVGLATATTDAAAPTTNFANNRGSNFAVVYSGPVTFQPGTSGSGGIGPVVVDLQLSAPFAYDPSLGQDLLVDIDLPPGQWGGGSIFAMDGVTSGTGVSRVSATTTYGGATGTITAGSALVLEIGYATGGIVADFTASTTSGATPLPVNFVDQSISTAPGGVTAWAWDFDGDNVIDSTQRHPTFVYTICGTYSVSLTVTDSLNRTHTRTQTDLIVTDELAPSFSITSTGPNTVVFTDTSTPPGTSWAWDLDGDSVIDSTSQQVAWTYPSSCIATTATLTVSRACRGPYTLSRSVLVSPGAAASTAAGGLQTTGSATTWPGNYFDLAVTNPQGVLVCALSVAATVTPGPIDVDVYLTPGSYVGKDTQPELWRLGSFGSGEAVGGSSTNPSLTVVKLLTPIYLPAGNWGLSVWINGFSGPRTLASSAAPLGPFTHPDVTICPNPATAPGIARTDWFGGALEANRVWNGVLHFSPAGPFQETGFGFFGVGCPGSLSASRYLLNNAPRAGQTMSVDISDLPQDLALVMLGFSRTSSVLGPLPLDATSLGAPGCQGLVSPDAVSIVLGANNAGAWSLPIPGGTGLLGLPLYTQALVPDAAANTLGAVFSDAYAILVGN